jgi:predicted nucleic acid-binding protein
MTGRIFVDTNVLVYARDASEPEKQARAMEWMERLWRGRVGRTSYQVLSEFYVTVTAKLSPGMPAEDARRDVRALHAWQPLSIDAAVLEGAWAVQGRYGLSWWDSLVVAAAQVLECRWLLTEDLRHGQDLAGVRVVDPFRTSPDSWAQGAV